MTRIHPAARAAAVVVAGLLTAVAGPAKAQTTPSCQGLTNPVYIGGSTAVKPALKTISKVLSAHTPPITLVYQSIGSCTGLDALIAGTPQSAKSLYWDATTNAETACDPGSGFKLDIGVSDVYPNTCAEIAGAGGLPATMADHQGVVQIMTFIAPTGSNQNSISAEAAKVVLGFGGATNPVSPWTNSADFFIRGNGSGTKNMIAKAINLAVAKWQGQIGGVAPYASESDGSGFVLTHTSTSADANGTIGIISADFADGNRDKVKTLAFQAKGQECGYFPNSKASTFDLLNVREGRYDIWGPVHVATNVTGGNPVPAAGNTGDVATIVKYITHNNLPPADELAMIDAEADAFTVPQCAMKVSRTTEVGPMSSFQPAKGCGCYFDKRKNPDFAGCTACTDNTGCSGATPHCNFGYCEAQ